MASSSIGKRFLRRTIGLLSIVVSVALIISYFSPYVSPESIWWFQLFGLAYPIILISFIVSLPLLFFVNRKRWWSLMIILILGLPVHLRYFSFGWDEEGSSEKENIKITSFNVRGFDTYQWTHNDLESAEQSFLDYIKVNDADVICFQEYTVDRRPSKHMQREEIKAAGNFKHFAEQLVVQTRKLDFGISIYSKFPIINQGIIGKEKELYALYVDLKVDKDTVRVYNTHLQSIRLQQDEYSLFDEQAMSDKGLTDRVVGLLRKLKRAYPSRIAQASSVLEHSTKSSYPTLICGDFNEPPTSYIYSLFNDRFHDAFRENSFGIGRTYAGKIPAGRIDYFFCNDKIKALDFMVQDDKLLSDHYPISMIFELKK
tara:strand:+ start:66963 stop:68075 length:1113 start_codon:yes stop_codon:yes gene_type:complete